MRIAAVLLALVAGAARAETVDASRYDAFWLWAGVAPQPALDKARRVYLLEGEVKAGDQVRLVAQRPATPHVRGAQVWMVVRVQTLDWPPSVYNQVTAALGRWRSAGNDVAGVQIDFDARTHRLADYAAFLAGFRRTLPAGCQLGVTGLLDWSSHGDPAGLASLAGVVDEIVLQIYQGRHVIPGYAAYLARLDRLNIPFRIGLLEGGDWTAPAGLEANPWFRGYVVFLRNPSAPTR
jgi:hypothetical protein